jgi:cell wall-active antibiotic response 4TMS protein YvqF
MHTTPSPTLAGHGGPHRGPVSDPGRLLIGLTVVAVGSIFLLDSAGVLDAQDTLGRWWPTLIIAAGLLALLERPRAVVRGTVLTGIGTFVLLFTTDVLEGDAWDYVWPSLVILAGVGIASRWHGRTIEAGASEEDIVRATAVFGGPDVASTSQRFQGAWLTAIFGGVTLDLRGARPAPGGATVNATAAFGGVDLLVPKGWKLSVRGTPIFGGVEDKTDHSVVPAEDAPTLYVDAVALFGGVGIKHDK